jgi:hypothetical protein
MLNYAQSARRWVEPLLMLRVGGEVAIRFLTPTTDPAAELGIVPSPPDSFVDYVAPSSYARELAVEELATTSGMLRQGAREMLLSEAFAQSVAASQGLQNSQEVFEGAAGLVFGGTICRIAGFKPMQCGAEIYAWQLLCDAPLPAS